MDTHDTLSETDKAELLRMVGITDDMAEAFSTPTVVAEVVTDTVTVTTVDTGDDAYATIAADLLKKAKGNLDTGKQLAINWAATEFDKVKLSKIQAAALGVDKTEHNKSEYARIQRERERVNSAMRKIAKGHVATKIAASKPKVSNPELDAFLLAHQGNAEIEQLMKLLG